MYFWTMEKKIIKTSHAPTPIGPYSQATLFGNLLFASGQIPINPTTGEMVTGGVKEEAVQVMENLKAVLAEAGMDFSHVLKSTIFITDMAKFGEVNEVYGSYFEDATAPARETVQVAALPKGVQVEISVIAGK